MRLKISNKVIFLYLEHALTLKARFTVFLLWGYFLEHSQLVCNRDRIRCSLIDEISELFALSVLIA
jgi:hypothetical protein